jgi:DNA-binding MarR family transcriptional regulator
MYLLSVSADEDARRSWEAIIRMFIGEENQRRFNDTAAAEGLSMRLLHALLDLSPTGARTMRELAEFWYCDASYVTSLVDGLEERSLATRDASPTDRRVKLVRLTPQGEAVRERATQRLSIPPSGVRSLSATELRTLRTLLEKAASGYPWPH